MSDTRNTAFPATYTLFSAAHTETLTGTLAQAIERAREIDAEYQPAFGVSVELDGETLIHGMLVSREDGREIRGAKMHPGMIQLGISDSLERAARRALEAQREAERQEARS